MRTLFAADGLVLPLVTEDPALETLNEYDRNHGIAALVIRVLPVIDHEGKRANWKITDIVLIHQALNLHEIQHAAVRTEGDKGTDAG